MSLLKSNYFEGKRDYMPWIYYNSTKWLISIGIDWFNFLTIADKNLWATLVYDWTNDRAHCWDWFQWWNNYMFTKGSAMYNYRIATQADTTWYWPNRYYSSSNWIYDSNAIYNPINLNLWWDVTNTVEARRWPCQEWYHVPSKSDFDIIYNYFTKYWIFDDYHLWAYLKMWKLGSVNEAWYPLSWWWYYLTSHMEVESWKQKVSAFSINDYWDESYYLIDAWRIWGIRPVYNNVEIPDSTRTVLYLPN